MRPAGGVAQELTGRRAAVAAAFAEVAAAAAATPAAIAASVMALLAVLVASAIRAVLALAAWSAAVAITATTATAAVAAAMLAVLVVTTVAAVRRGGAVAVGLGGLGAAEEVFQPTEETAGFFRGRSGDGPRPGFALLECRFAARFAGFERPWFLAWFARVA